MKKSLDKVTLLSAIAIVLAWGSVAYGYYNSMPKANIETKPNAKVYDKSSLSDDEVLANLNEVFAFPDVPKQAFKLMNKDSLRKEDPFYANVEDGDYLVMFDNASRAVIYRPSTHKIVNLGPFVYSNN